MGVKILLVDDEVMFAENLKVVLETYAPDFEVVDIAYDGKQAIRKAREMQPSVILMDVRMPTLDGVGATKLILQELPYIRIIMLTIFDDDEYVHQAIEHGASGYLLKNMRPRALVSSIQSVLEGAVLISPVVAQKLASKHFKSEEESAHEAPPWLADTGPRERQVLSLLVQELSNQEIAERLGISETTVRNYMTTLYDKLGAENRFHAMRIAGPYRRFLEGS